MTGLVGVCEDKGLDALSKKLIELRGWLAADLEQVESAIGGVGRAEDVAQKSVRHLLDQGGKRLRPVCVALAARVGAGFDETARAYAVAVELVHNATLLHDDVIDLGDVRRGSATARVVYGNAASIFGGDWLLVDALCRIEAAGKQDVLLRMFEVIKVMVIAESAQLARRGRLDASVDSYFRIVEGKTASLFQWAMYAGARAGGVDERATRALEDYGKKLGVAFQIVDDVLDIAGDARVTGKALLVDLREGKITYPLLLAMERDPSIVPSLEVIAAGGELDSDTAAVVSRAIQKTHAAEDAVALATRLCEEASTALEVVPAGRARSALESVAASTPKRRK
jgi:octaprenyl-diphosphate synthase